MRHEYESRRLIRRRRIVGSLAGFGAAAAGLVIADRLNPRLPGGDSGINMPNLGEMAEEAFDTMVAGKRAIENGIKPRPQP